MKNYSKKKRKCRWCGKEVDYSYWCNYTCANNDKRHRSKNKKKGIKVSGSSRPDIVYLDGLWAKVIKSRSGFKSEVSGKAGKQIEGEYIVVAHHIIHKPNHYLRYSLENGVCITSGEHKFDAHGGREESFRQLLIEKKGYDIYEKLRLYVKNPPVVNLYEIEEMLLKEIRRYV